MTSRGKLFIVSHTLLLLIALYFAKEYYAIKGEFYGLYFQTQHGINDYIKEGITSSQQGDQIGLIQNLILASQEFRVASNLLAEGTPLGRKLGYPDNAYLLHRQGMNLIEGKYRKALVEELTDTDLAELRDYSKRIDTYVQRIIEELKITK